MAFMGESIVKVSLKGARQSLYFLFIAEAGKRQAQKYSLLIITVLTEQEAVGNISTILEVHFS